jgi:hypothetical protein
MRSSGLALLLITASAGAAEPKAELLNVRRIGDRAPHNAFTDLLRAGDRWYCVFREGKAHVSPDGAICVLTSTDGERWDSAALVKHPAADLRDPKLSLHPDGRLMLLTGAALHEPKGHTHESFVWFSKDGADWGEPTKVAADNDWLWRVAWHRGTAYGVGYACAKPPNARLYRSADGRTFTPLLDRLGVAGEANESALAFLPDDTALCLLRRDGRPASGLLGTARPPYTEWSWKELGWKIGGPSLVRLPGGELIAGVRLYEPKVRTVLCRLDAAAGTLTELLTLPSGGDTSYPGLAWHDGVVWVSYYSSHEGKTAVYLARVKVTP